MNVVSFVDHCNEGWQHTDGRDVKGHPKFSAWALQAVEDSDAQTRQRIWEGSLQKINEILEEVI